MVNSQLSYWVYRAIPGFLTISHFLIKYEIMTESFTVCAFKFNDCDEWIAYLHPTTIFCKTSLNSSYIDTETEREEISELEIALLCPEVLDQ